MTPDTATRPQRLRIAVLERVFSTSAGGAERYCASLVQHLADKHDIHVYAQDIQVQYPHVVFHQVPLFCRRPRWVNQIAFALYTWWHTRDGFDVVHSHENTWHGQVQTVHVLPFTYLWFSQHHGWQLFLRYLQWLTSPRLLTYWGLEKLRLRKSKAKWLVAVSDPVKLILEKLSPLMREDIVVITPGLESTSVPTLEEKQQARKNLHLPTDGQCLVWVGNNAVKKGLPALLGALARLPDSVFLLMIGRAAPDSAWRKQVAALGLESRVYHQGVLDDITVAYLAADVLVHPTLEDTFGMVVLEAMGHGVPVIVSAAQYCGIAASLQHLNQAWILPNPSDIADLALAIEKTLAPTQHAAFSHAAIAWARDQNWSQRAQLQEAVYFQVVQKKA